MTFMDRFELDKEMQVQENRKQVELIQKQSEREQILRGQQISELMDQQKKEMDRQKRAMIGDQVKFAMDQKQKAMAEDKRKEQMQDQQNLQNVMR